MPSVALVDGHDASDDHYTSGPEHTLQLIGSVNASRADRGLLLRKHILLAGVLLCTLLVAACYGAGGKAASSLIESADVFVEEFQPDSANCHIAHDVHKGGCDSHLQKSLDLLACKKECIKHKHCLGIEHHDKECHLLIGEKCDFQQNYRKKVCYGKLAGVRHPEGPALAGEEGGLPLLKHGEERCHACRAADDVTTCKAMCTSQDECKSFSYGQWGKCSACCLKQQQVKSSDSIIVPKEENTSRPFLTHYQRPCEHQGGWHVESRSCFDCASIFKISRGHKFDSGRRQACGPAYMGPHGHCVVKSVFKGKMEKCPKAGEVRAARVQEHFKTKPARFTPRGVIPPDGKMYYAMTCDGATGVTANPTDLTQVFDHGMQIPVFGIFTRLPLRGIGENNYVRDWLSNAASLGAIAYITSEPHEGLWKVDQRAAEELAWLCQTFENQGGAGCIVRFGHEMNGNWYIWGQKPYLYKDKFRLLGDAIHRLTKRSGMMWAPSTGGEYPFEGYFKEVSSPDFKALDTNNDGVMDMSDDMYTPFYPGDDVVDWVGLTNTFFGNAYPFDRNELAQPNLFIDKIRGGLHSNALDGKEHAVPDFYEMFCGENSQHKKPFAVAETGALWGQDIPCSERNHCKHQRSELEIKQRWWRQVFLEGSAHFPKMKMVLWPEAQKTELGMSAQPPWDLWIDWRILANPNIKHEFQEDILQGDARDKFAWQADLTAWIQMSLQSPDAASIAVELK